MSTADLLSIAYWIVALVASALYGWHAVTIFLEPQEPSESHRSTAWAWHQRWLNFLGALVGWFALWFLVRAFGACVFAACTVELGPWHAVAALIAFVGVTGYLPNTVVSLVSGIGGLAGKLAEVLASFVVRK
jgi:hypothetical protein